MDPETTFRQVWHQLWPLGKRCELGKHKEELTQQVTGEERMPAGDIGADLWQPKMLLAESILFACTSLEIGEAQLCSNLPNSWQKSWYSGEDLLSSIFTILSCPLNAFTFLSPNFPLWRLVICFLPLSLFHILPSLLLLTAMCSWPTTPTHLLCNFLTCSVNRAVYWLRELFRSSHTIAP